MARRPKRPDLFERNRRAQAEYYAARRVGVGGLFKVDLTRPHAKSKGWHEAANAVRLMTYDEYAALEASVKQHGQRESIKVLDGKILDGRHRERACLELGVDPDYQPVRFDDVAQARQYVRDTNLVRRHLSTYERALLAVEAVSTEGPGRPKNTDESAIKVTEEDAARMYCIGVDSVQHAKGVRQHVDLHESVRNGERSLKSAFKIAQQRDKPRDPSPKNKRVTFLLPDDAAQRLLADALELATARRLENINETYALMFGDSNPNKGAQQARSCLLVCACLSITCATWSSATTRATTRTTYRSDARTFLLLFHFDGGL